MPAAAAQTVNVVGSGGVVQSASILLLWGAKFPDNTPVWNRTVSTYYVFLRKTMLHEIGHTMGIDHPGINTPVQSIMNGFSGTNDSGTFGVGGGSGDRGFESPPTSRIAR